MDDALRLVVGTAGGPRSSSWKAGVARDGSFYILPREMKGAVKVSLHPPNEKHAEAGWFFGFDGDFVKHHPIEPSNHGRTEQFWSDDLAPGLTRVCTVQVPDHVVSLRRDLKRAAELVWLPPPNPGMCRTITYLLASSHVADQARAHRSYVGHVVGADRDLIVLQGQIQTPNDVRLEGHLSGDATLERYANVRGVALGRRSDDGSVIVTEIVAEPAGGGAI